ncbi:CAP domain-containing protein [Candidatus Thiodictyon syntrophicum]|jgi:uncharacterized protein YkwD|nr:CAP domain-containing protein [Candidatus Thiodictyon syntrophicum]
MLMGCAVQSARERPPHADAVEQWSPADLAIAGAGGLLTPEERDVVTHINLARSNPAAYARLFLRPRRILFHGKIYLDPLDPRGRGLRTHEGSAAVDEAAQELDETAPMGPLLVSAALTRAARMQAAEQAATGETGHGGRDGSTPSARIADQGHWEWIVGEVAAYGPVSGREIVSRLLIDDGVTSRGHRRNILDPRFGAVGVSIASHPRFGRTVIIDFADAIAEAEP